MKSKGINEMHERNEKTSRNAFSASRKKSGFKKRNELKT